jgi:hypothetical protein
MEQLPYIDEHSIVIGATREHVWGVLVSSLRTNLGRPAPAALTRPLRLAPAGSRGDWRTTPKLGDSLPGFEVTEIYVPGRLVLRGRHRFSRYALIFELDDSGKASCALRAQTWAEFPGVAGRSYRLW